MKDNLWLDITIPIRNGMVTWPGDRTVTVSKSSTIGVNDAEANVTAISLSAHTGTHIDAPLHFMPDGTDITTIPFDHLIGPAKVIHITDAHQITFSELKEADIESGDRLLFRTRNSDSDWSMQPFMEDYVYLSTNAAQYLIKLGVMCIGVDYLSVAGEENGKEVHQLILGEGITIIEGLDLRAIVPGNYEMIALPMKIAGADGAPARVLIRKA
jgi:arylformamidase